MSKTINRVELLGRVGTDPEMRYSQGGTAIKIIVAHNHPSHDPEPSPEDVAVTKALAQAATLLDIELLDHVVIGSPRVVSLKDRGLISG